MNKLEFRFDYPENFAVFTLRSIFHENKPILYVRHDEDDTWQFLTGSEVSTGDLIIVSLIQVFHKDATVNDLYDLPPGYCATRRFIGDRWNRMKISD
jgi:hypothetical protein